LIIGGFDIQTTFTTMIEDCRDQIHFSEHFFKNHLIRLQNDVNQAMDQLNQKIDDKFNAAIDAINIKSHLDHIEIFLIAVNSASITIGIGYEVEQISDALKIIQTSFGKIVDSIPILPANMVNQTINDVSIRERK
jgi:hypothetical protein